MIDIFVDDFKLLVTGNPVAEISTLRERMNEKFILSDQGQSEYYLGVEISKLDDNNPSLHQTAYARKILRNFDMMESNPVKTPLPRDLNPSLMDYPEEVDPMLQASYSKECQMERKYLLKELKESVRIFS